MPVRASLSPPLYTSPLIPRVTANPPPCLPPPTPPEDCANPRYRCVPPVNHFFSTHSAKSESANPAFRIDGHETRVELLQPPKAETRFVSMELEMIKRGSHNSWPPFVVRYDSVDALEGVRQPDLHHPAAVNGGWKIAEIG